MLSIPNLEPKRSSTDFTVKRVNRAVAQVDLNVDGPQWEQWFMLRSDAHHDNRKAKNALERVHLEKAKAIGAGIIDAGDALDLMQSRNDRRRSQDDIKPEHVGDSYLDLVLDDYEDFLAPYADNFVSLGMGNHESAVVKHIGVNPTFQLARRLRRHATRADRCFGMGYSHYVIFRATYRKTVRQSIVLKVYHGSGGGGKVTRGVIGTARRAAYLPDADIVLTGHVHEAWVVYVPRQRVSQGGKIYMHNQVHVCAPTYKAEVRDQYGGFGAEKEFNPKPIGCAWLRMYYEGGIVKYQITHEIDDRYDVSAPAHPMLDTPL